FCTLRAGGDEPHLIPTFAAEMAPGVRETVAGERCVPLRPGATAVVPSHASVKFRGPHRRRALTSAVPRGDRRGSQPRERQVLRLPGPRTPSSAEEIANRPHSTAFEHRRSAQRSARGLQPAPTVTGPPCIGSTYGPPEAPSARGVTSTPTTAPHQIRLSSHTGSPRQRRECPHGPAVAPLAPLHRRHATPPRTHRRPGGGRPRCADLRPATRSVLQRRTMAAFPRLVAPAAPRRRLRGDAGE